jgi:hypothetical protein
MEFAAVELNGFVSLPADDQVAFSNDSRVTRLVKLPALQARQDVLPGSGWNCPAGHALQPFIAYSLVAGVHVVATATPL